MSMQIKYGTIDHNIDVTDICFSKLKRNNIILIPSNDDIRCSYFTDPLFRTLKSVFVLQNDILTEYTHDCAVKINTLDNTVSVINKNNTPPKLKQLHSKLKIKYGTFYDELPEQKMAANYLTGEEKVLEIGGNIGRNSLIIGSILESNNNTNFVTLESDSNIANQLKVNRDLNNLNFNIEASALSKRKLIQKGWNTIVSDVLLEGYKWVNTITFDEIKSKYNIKFDTLILDCEGAFYYILMDMPEILDNINLIIMENDYYDISKKEYIDEILKKNNFYNDYVEDGGSQIAYNIFPTTFLYFFEVWRKKIDTA
jgi:FkbM family methyltransferase